jgi:hypothetical protein
MMRFAAFLALTAGILAATPDAASAATEKLDFTMIVSGGTAN